LELGHGRNLDKQACLYGWSLLWSGVAHDVYFSVRRIWRKAAPKDFIEHIGRQTHAKTAQNSGTKEP